MKRLLLVLLSIGLVIAGCGEGNTSNGNAVITVEDPEAVNPVDLVRAAAEQTGSLTSFRADHVTSLTGLPFIGEYVQPASILQAANGDNSITMDLADTTIDGERLPSELFDYALEIRHLDDKIYISLPEEDMRRFADTKWVSITRNQVAEEELEYFEGFDPKEQLNFLLGVDEDAVVSHGEEVDGVIATRISGESTFEQILATLSAEEQQEMLDSALSFFTAQDISSDEVISIFNELNFEFDVWINEEGYILQNIVFLKNFDQIAGAIDPTISDWIEAVGDIEMTYETRFFDHGAPVTIVEPPPEEVTPYEGSLDSLLS
ncbi:MAG: hypothetical protein OXF00_04510 [bacterium]|nr:hypothetical protein [bacterium]